MEDAFHPFEDRLEAFGIADITTHTGNAQRLQVRDVLMNQYTHRTPAFQEFLQEHPANESTGAGQKGRHVTHPPI